MREAVHRLDAVGLLVHLGEIHVIPVVVEMSRTFPELGLEDLGADDDVVAAPEVFLPLPILDDRSQQGAFGVPDDQTRTRLLVDLEQIQFPSEAAVVALAGLFQDTQMFVERLLRREAGPVNPLEHLVALIPSPVGAGDAEELEGPDHARRRDMGPPAQVDVAVLGIKADRLHLGGEIVDQFDLVVFPLLLKELHRLFTAHLAALEGDVRRRNLPHPLLDLFEVLRREGLRIFKIVIEAVFDRGPDAHLNAGEGVLDRLGHHVGHAVPENGESFGRIDIDRLDNGIGVQTLAQIDRHSVDLRRHRKTALPLFVPARQDIPHDGADGMLCLLPARQGYLDPLRHHSVPMKKGHQHYAMMPPSSPANR